MTRLLLAVPVLLSLACENDANPIAPGDTDEGTSAATAGPTGTTSDATDSSSSGPATTDDPGSTGVDEAMGTSTGGAPGDESSTGDEPPPPDYATPHFPLQVGLQWSYRLTRTDGSTGETCIDDGAVHVMRMTEESAGVFTRTEAPFCDFESLAFRIDGAYVDVNNGAWYHQLLLPPEQDATWGAGGASGATYIWDEFHPSYSVEAGTFEDCWRRKQQGYDVWEIYCRDVGMVESYYDAWGSNTRSELVAFEG